VILKNLFLERRIKMEQIQSNISIESARIGFRNFAGAAGKFNALGNRNFCVFLEQDLGKVLEADGWNVRWLTPRDEDEERQPYLQVGVAFGAFPPKIVLISSSGKNILDEETVNMLDWAEIKTIDLIIRPYNWEVNGKSGVKAYLKSMYVTLVEDEFEGKYVDVPDSAVKSFVDQKW
jgi:hypothetical protein